MITNTPCDGDGTNQGQPVNPLATTDAAFPILGTTSGTRFEELKSINLSLSALGNCISALAAKRSHIPYRDSRLTRLLQGSLGGNAKTALVITVAPEPEDAAETQSTLEFGQRARKVQVRAVVNMVTDYKSLYQALQSRVDKESDEATALKLEVRRLKAENEKLRVPNGWLVGRFTS